MSPPGNLDPDTAQTVLALLAASARAGEAARSWSPIRMRLLNRPTGAAACARAPGDRPPAPRCRPVKSAPLTWLLAHSRPALRAPNLGVR